MIYIIREDLLNYEFVYNEYYLLVNHSNNINEEYIKELLLEHDEDEDEDCSIGNKDNFNFFRILVEEKMYNIEINSLDDTDYIVMG